MTCKFFGQSQGTCFLLSKSNHLLAVASYFSGMTVVLIFSYNFQQERQFFFKAAMGMI